MQKIKVLHLKKRFYDSLKITVLISFSFQHSLIKIETKYMWYSYYRWSRVHFNVRKSDFKIKLYSKVFIVFLVETFWSLQISRFLPSPQIQCLLLGLYYGGSFKIICLLMSFQINWSILNNFHHLYLYILSKLPELFGF